MLSFDANNYDINSLKDLSVDAAAILKKREGRTIKAGGLWVYDNEIAQFRGVFEDGDIMAISYPLRISTDISWATVSSTVNPGSRSAFSPAGATIR